MNKALETVIISLAVLGLSDALAEEGSGPCAPVEGQERLMKNFVAMCKAVHIVLKQQSYFLYKLLIRRMLQIQQSLKPGCVIALSRHMYACRSAPCALATKRRFRGAAEGQRSYIFYGGQRGGNAICS